MTLAQLGLNNLKVRTAHTVTILCTAILYILKYTVYFSIIDYTVYVINVVYCDAVARTLYAVKRIIRITYMGKCLMRSKDIIQIKSAYTINNCIVLIVIRMWLTDVL